MARGYGTDEIKQRLAEILGESKTGLSGVEIAERLGISRVTITKYLHVLAAEGLIRRKDMGNVGLWFAEEGAEGLQFPDDYFQAQKRYQDFLLAYSEDQAHTLIKNCLYSGADVPKIMAEVIAPTVNYVKRLFDDGKIGSLELNLLNHTISGSIRLAGMAQADSDSKKNAVLIAADSASVLRCECAAASLRTDGWRVSVPGDMSASINVLFDLDLQKFLGKIWRQKSGIMIVFVFSETEEGLKFFAESVNSAKEKIGRGIRLVLCGKAGKKTAVDADLITEDADAALQWSQTVYERSAGKRRALR